MHIDDAECEALAARCVAGDAEACRVLVERLWPQWLDMVRASRSLGPLSRAEDVVHDVIALLVEKIGRVNGRALRSYPAWRERHPDKTFSDWMRIVTKNTIRDYAREQLGSRRTSEEPSVKRLLNEFASSLALEELGARPPFTAAQTARELLEFAVKRLPEAQLGVLGLWLEGVDFDEIGLAREVPPEQARQLLRAAIATLRRQFSTPASSS